MLRKAPTEPGNGSGSFGPQAKPEKVYLFIQCFPVTELTVHECDGINFCRTRIIGGPAETAYVREKVEVIHRDLNDLIGTH